MKACRAEGDVGALWEEYRILQRLNEAHEKLEDFVSLPTPGLFYGRMGAKVEDIPGSSKGAIDGRMIPAAFVMECVPDLPRNLKERLSRCRDPNTRYVPRLTLASAKVEQYVVHAESADEQGRVKVTFCQIFEKPQTSRSPRSRNPRGQNLIHDGASLRNSPFPLPCQWGRY